MTIISAQARDTAPLRLETLRPYYQGSGQDALKFGTEIEFAIARNPCLSAPDWSETQALQGRLQGEAVSANIEPPTSAVELTSAAFDRSALPALLEAIETATTHLHQAAHDLSLTLSPFGHWPQHKPDDIHVAQTERYQSFFAPPRPDMQAFFEFFTQCMNIQVSLGYADPDHLLRIVRLATVLEPVIALTTDSSCGWDKGQRAAHIQNLARKLKMGVNTGVPSFYATAQTGAALVDAHITYSLHNPHAFTVFDAHGRLQRLPEGQWARFSDFEACGYGPQDLQNYLQTQSQHWRRAVNIATIVDGEGALLNHRAELCAFQTGLLHQRSTAVIVGYLIGYDPVFYTQTEDVLRVHGIDLNALDPKALEANFRAACFHDNQYHAVPFGQTGKTVGDFAVAWADILEAAADRHDVHRALAPCLHILRSGRPDWLVYRETLPSYEAVKAYMHRFSDRVQDQPALISSFYCADQLTL